MKGDFESVQGNVTARPCERIPERRPFLHYSREPLGEHVRRIINVLVKAVDRHTSILLRGNKVRDISELRPHFGLRLSPSIRIQRKRLAQIKHLLANLG